MDFGLSREQEMLRKTVREFAENELRPREAEFSQPEGEWPYDVWNRIAELGLIGLAVPKEYGGSGMGHLARMVAIEEISRVYPSWGAHLRGFGLVPYLLLNHGTEEQKKKYIPRLVKGEIQGSLANTEATGGSDMIGIETTAKLDGDHYIINGRKVMISRSTVSDVFAVTARTGERDRDISAILIEANTPGFQRGRVENLIAHSRTSPVGEFTMTDCRVPVANRVGAEHRGLGVILGAINGAGRTGGAGICLGIAQAAVEIGTKYAKERHLYGKPLTDLQSILFWIGEMERHVVRARWLCYHAAWLLDQGKRPEEIRAEIAMAKLDASEAALHNCLKAIEIHGAYGTATEFGLIRKFKAALDMIAAAGSNNISRLIMSGATVEKY